jgi:uncharacterized FlaG/YvyC family protein
MHKRPRAQEPPQQSKKTTSSNTKNTTKAMNEQIRQIRMQARYKYAMHTYGRQT